MVNEEFYKNMAASLATAKKQLAAAEDLMAFATEAQMPIAIDATQVQDLRDKIATMQAALEGRGYTVA